MNRIKCYDNFGAQMKYLYQWDSNQNVIISGVDANTVDEVHFCNVDSEKALVVKPTAVDSGISAAIPNILLQQPKPIVLYIVTDDGDATARTVREARIVVVPRPQPSDYVYTETEVLNYRAIDDRITELENKIFDSGSSADDEYISSPSIIDVTELPAYNINKNVFYRLSAGSLIYNQYVQETYSVHIVETLPEVGMPATNAEQSVGNIYYCTTDSEAYGYVDDILSMGMGVPVGWYDGSTLLGALGYEYKGAITDIKDDPFDDSFRLLLSKDFYIYQDGWRKLPFAYEKQPEFDIQWDGVIGDRFALDVSSLGFANTSFVKVSDEVFTIEQLVGFTIRTNNGDEGVIDESVFDTITYTGAIKVGDYIVVVHSSDDLNAALGLPAGYVTNGTYFVYINDGTNVIYINRLVAPAKVTKIDSKYLDFSEISIDYNNVTNKPIIYTDVIRYNTTQNLSSTYKAKARTNIDVYSRSEVDTKIANSGTSVDLSEYAKTSDLSYYAKTADVEDMIAEAIGAAIGSEY